MWEVNSRLMDFKPRATILSVIFDSFGQTVVPGPIVIGESILLTGGLEGLLAYCFDLPTQSLLIFY